jgi:hypothetical protein
MTTKIPCTTCGAQILPSTAARTGGVCMPCNAGYRGVLDESKARHAREKNTPQSIQENLTGFIVEVRSKTQAPISYQYDSKSKTLKPSETFVGYFWQMTDKQDDGTWEKAYIHETRLVDISKKLFSYGGKAIFSYNEVLLTILALRGPDSNNRYLSREFEIYETWNSAERNV